MPVEVVEVVHGKNLRPNAKFHYQSSPESLATLIKEAHVSKSVINREDMSIEILREALTHRLTTSLPQDSELVSAWQLYEIPVVGSSYPSMVFVPTAQRKYCEIHAPIAVLIWRFWTVLQLPS